MRSEILNSLVSLLDQNKLTPLLGGGWAVAHHGYPRFTQDIDFIFSQTDKKEVSSAMLQIGCKISFDLPIATRFQHSNLFIPAIDALWIEPKSYSRLLQNSEPDPKDSRLKVVSLIDLIAMKLHALASQAERGTRDEDDIKFLLAANPNHIQIEDYQDLIKKHAPVSFHKKLTSYYPASS